MYDLGPIISQHNIWGKSNLSIRFGSSENMLPYPYEILFINRPKCSIAPQLCLQGFLLYTEIFNNISVIVLYLQIRFNSVFQKMV